MKHYSPLSKSAAEFMLWLLGRLPVSWAQALAGVLSAAIFAMSAKTRGRARNNIRRALPELDTGRVNALARCSYRNIVAGLFECLHLDKIEMEWRCDQATLALLNSNRALSIATLHMGCYEVVPLGIQRITGRSVTLSKLPAYLPSAAKIYQQAGIQVIDKQSINAFLKLLSAVTEKQVVSLHSDLYGSDTAVRFFDQSTTAPAGAAMLSAYSGCPLLLAYAVRISPFRYQLHVETLFADAVGRDRAKIDIAVQAIYNRFEQIIKCHPQQWYWSYNRWRNVSVPPLLPGNERATS